MVQIPINITDIIQKFLLESEKNNIHIQQAILFGSYAKGTQHEFSDIDLAIVSEDFQGIRLLDNVKLDKPALNSSYDLETHPFRPEDFTEDNPFVKEILKEGIRIK